MLKRTLLNVTFNTAWTVTSMVSGFLMMPFLISKLGVESYGLWMLVGALTGLFGILDFGVAGAVGRKVAYHHSRGEQTEVNITLSTALVLLLAAAVVAALLTLVAIPVFFMLFDVAADRAADVRHALLIVGLNLALSFPAFVFFGFLWGRERFDLQNMIDIPVLSTRTVATFLLIDTGSSLTRVATIVIIVNQCGFLARIAMCWWLEPRLRLGRGLVKRSAAKEIYSFGLWFFLSSMSRNVLPQIGPTIIGNHLSVAAVTTFAVAKQLAVYSDIFSVAATQVLTPYATGLHARGEYDQQRKLLHVGGRYSAALALFLVGGLALLGMPFIELWLHGQQNQAYQLLLILLAGELLPMTQSLTFSTIIAMSQHRRLGWFAIAEGVTIVVLAIMLVRPYGLMGVCVAIATAAFIFRGVLQLRYGCGLLQISLGAYCREVLLPVLVASLPAFGLAWLLIRWQAPTTWLGLVLTSAAYVALYALCVTPTAFRDTQLLRKGWLMATGRLREGADIDID